MYALCWNSSESPVLYWFEARGPGLTSDSPLARALRCSRSVLGPPTQRENKSNFANKYFLYFIMLFLLLFGFRFSNESPGAPTFSFKFHLRLELHFVTILVTYYQHKNVIAYISSLSEQIVNERDLSPQTERMKQATRNVLEN